MSRLTRLPSDLLGPLAAAERIEFDNGLTCYVVANRQAPIVSTALRYGVGAAHDPAEEEGTAHFLEHMMFKGSDGYGPGEIDRRTEALGGTNNAFTSHDATVYHFSFARDCWQEALRIEADRMSSLHLAGPAVDSEREVIREEVRLYEDDPWDSLEAQVHRAFFGEHPYGKPILGTGESLDRIDGDRLRAFHQLRYRPENAVLVVAGDVTRAQTEREITGTLGDLDFRARPRGTQTLESAAAIDGVRRVTRRRGESARLLIAMPGPPAEHRDFAALQLAVAALAVGRDSPLQSRLVEEGQLCSAADLHLHELVAGGMVTLAAEALPGVDCDEIEEVSRREIERLHRAKLDAERLERARVALVSEWVFGLERVHRQALTVAAGAPFGDGHWATYLDRVMRCDASRICEVADRYLVPSRSAVIGWSFPEVGVEG